VSIWIVREWDPVAVNSQFTVVDVPAESGNATVVRPLFVADHDLKIAGVEASPCAHCIQVKMPLHAKMLDEGCISPFYQAILAGGHRRRQIAEHYPAVGLVLMLIFAVSVA